MSKNIVYSLVLVFVLMGVLGLAFRIQRVEASGTIYIRADGSVDPPTANITTADNITYTFTDNNYDSIVVERNNIVVDGRGYTVQGTGNGGIDGRAGIDLSYRNNVTLKNVEVANFYIGIRLEYSINNILTGNNALNNMNGIYVLSSSDNNVLANNTFSSNFYTGFRLISSSNNILTGNTALNNTDGIQLWSSSNNILIGNTASNNHNGIYIYSSSNNTLIGNTASSNGNMGIYFQSSSDNTINNNTASNNDYGISLWSSSDNTIFNNNFTDNNFEAYVTPGYVNTWDNGYPSGGNYWSDYEDKYPDAEEIDGTGIWDTPYVIDENNQDNYPLMPEFPTWTSMLLILILVTVATVIYKRRPLKTPIH